MKRLNPDMCNLYDLVSWGETLQNDQGVFVNVTHIGILVRWTPGKITLAEVMTDDGKIIPVPNVFLVSRR